MSVVALSTMWMSPLGYDPLLPPAEAAAKILQRAEQVGAEALELDYRIRQEVLEALAELVRAEAVAISSLHAPLPIPQGLTQPTAEPFNPASTDPEERAMAVKHICRTLEWAHELEAGVVVVHMGCIPELADTTLTKAAAKADAAAAQRLEKQLCRRAELAPRHLDMASFCLEKLVKRAEELGVVLGLENRYHFFEIPSLQELKLLLKRFEGAPVGPWYDLGHGYVQALAGICPWQQWLETLGGLLLGCHIHDAQGPHDHQPPGSGEMPWQELGPRLAGIERKVVEVTNAHGAKEVAEGLALARERFHQPMEQPQ